MRSEMKMYPKENSKGEENMIIAQSFVEFIFYSFLGWVWESIYCTIKEKKWADRGFLFGPVCPIYGSCVVIVKLLFTQVSFLASPDVPLWQIFLICMVGSAIAEYGTSWVLEMRFHARWWDYSTQPFNLNGRICLPVSTAFGLAGIVVVKYLIPYVTTVGNGIPALAYEMMGIAFALVFGADFALTEASLNNLLNRVEEMHAEANWRAESTYQKMAATPEIVGSKISAVKDMPRQLGDRISDVTEAQVSATAEKIGAAMERPRQFGEMLGGAVSDSLEKTKEREAAFAEAAKRSARRLSGGERHALKNIKTFVPRPGKYEHASIAEQIRKEFISFENMSRKNWEENRDQLQ